MEQQCLARLLDRYAWQQYAKGMLVNNASQKCMAVMFHSKPQHLQFESGARMIHTDVR